MNPQQYIKVVYYICIAFFMNACATYSPQFAEPVPVQISSSGTKDLLHTFYIAGGFGNKGNGGSGGAENLLASALASAPEESTLIFTGDNISENEGAWSEDKDLLDEQIKLLDNFKGKTIFLPGNNEWKEFDSDKVEKIEDYIKDLEQDKISFYPENACPIEHMEINDKLDLIVVDSKWFISNWSRVKDINKKCTDINTRRRFLEELEGYINDGQDKNIVIAMHHPIFSNGKYAGKESFKSHITPIPVLGTVMNGISDLGAFSPELLNSRRYNYLRILVSALAKASDRITIVSGHEESLQYLTGGGIHQVIGGSLFQKTPTKLGADKITTIGGSLDYEGKYTHGAEGFAKLEYFKDGSSKVTFISEGDDKNTINILPKLDKESAPHNFPVISNSTKKDAVTDNKEELNKSGFYKFLWGERYRNYFGTSVTAPIAYLDTLYGGLKVTKEGGGHQSYSIRLEDNNGREFSMRSLRKNALKFLKFKVKGIAFEENDYKDTWTEEVISDFFTTAHPYMQLVINPLAQAVNVNHSSPSLFYIPKQERLGDLNEQFGDELYFIEERPSDEQTNFKGYRRTIDESGKMKEMESTTDMLEKISGDESYTIDQRDFIRARIFDMLIGDWDRHQDQWRWAEYEKKDGDKEFLPIPRDRDNAFPKFDGFAMKAIKLFVPDARRWQSYGPEINDVKWLNIGGNRLDRTLLTQYDAKVWEEEARFIQDKLSEREIDAAFLKLPIEVQDSTSNDIKESLKLRLTNLPKYAKQYADYLDNIVTLHGTEKDDLVEITRLPEGKTKVVLRRLLSDEPNEKMFERTFESKKTKEIWIYGLGDDDIFEVSGDGDNEIFIRLIGGYGKETYNITNSASLKVYDWKHEEIKFEEKKPSHQLTDVYETNTFHWRFLEENSNVFLPAIGFRTDDGFYMGVKNTYLNRGFNGHDFRQKHIVGANYYFLFKALELSYQGVYANIIPKWNFELEGYYTSNRFSNNYFGFGNETVNLEDDLGRDYYRARMQKIQLNAGIAYHTLKIKALYESFKSKELQDRFFVPSNLDPQIFDSQHYVGAETSAYYKNDDAADFPTKALYLGLTAGYKLNTQIADNQFGYFAFKAGISHKLIPSGDLVLGTTAEYKTNIGGGEYFFYHAPTLGGTNGLRGFRDERFAGHSYFYQTTDLRFRIKKYATAVAPVTLGVFGGFDYGRVWERNDSSNRWHTSQGGGLWISGFNFLSFNVGYFNSVEGNMVQIGFGFGF
ncbi:hypothetical protein H4O18_00365 [Arenibacter sp. BSSL-BM3]|uniref:Haemolysin activator HlyB C-terminal domain-containing protein n=1 Tax=Arenibacter arenosicollis TaxID=2762274 RepID=A0ABR7QGZ8_9FLAO|nr:hypothetical protein [Arenibacter arenosicollis]MBC8766430.1 hypothetical protein [Arenibacter arenosicollis]